MDIKRIIKEEADFYNFKKEVRKLLASKGMFINDIGISGDANVYIDFNLPKQLNLNNQFFILLYRFLQTQGFDANTLFEILKIVKDFEKLYGDFIMIKSRYTKEVEKKATLYYESNNLNTLSEVLNDFNVRLKHILQVSDFKRDVSLMYELESYLDRIFFRTQKKMLNNLIIDHDEDFNTLTLQKSKDDEYKDVKFGVKLNRDDYFLEGLVLINYDLKEREYEYSFEFKTTEDLYGIMNAVLNSL